MLELLGILATTVGVVGIMALIGFPLAILRGWVLSWLWLWFLVPLGLPAIGVVNAIGLAGTVGFLTMQYQPSGEGKTGEKLAFGILYPLIALGSGYIVHLFM